MGFFSNLWKLVILGIGVVCAVLLILALALPWYSTLTTYPSSHDRVLASPSPLPRLSLASPPLSCGG